MLSKLANVRNVFTIKLQKIEVLNSEFEASFKIFTGTVNVMSCDHLIEDLQIISIK